MGIGKPLFVGCIASVPFDRDVPVLMTNFPIIPNWMTEMFTEERTAFFIASLDEYNLLIIDDLGVERSTNYTIE